MFLNFSQKSRETALAGSKLTIPGKKRMIFSEKNLKHVFNFGENQYFSRFWLGKGRKVACFLIFSQKSGEATLAGLAGSKPIKQQTGIQNPYIFQEIIKNMSEIFQTYSISEICQTYFRNISDPEPNQYWGVRKKTENNSEIT